MCCSISENKSSLVALKCICWCLAMMMEVAVVDVRVAGSRGLGDRSLPGVCGQVGKLPRSWYGGKILQAEILASVSIEHQRILFKFCPSKCHCV